MTTEAAQSSFAKNDSAHQDFKIIAVTAGKGGVGKTNVSVNLACATAKLGKKVLLLDADLSLANVDVLLGLKAQYNIEHVIRGECKLTDIIIQGPYGVDIIPGSSGSSLLTHLSYVDHAGLINAFDELHQHYDFMFVDTPAGITDNVAAFLRASQEIIIVVCNEPTSITDAYALMKVMSQEYQIRHFHLLANMVHNLIEGRDLYHRLSQVTNDYLDITLDYIGAIPFDNYLRQAVKEQRSIYEMFPSAESSVAFKKLASELVNWPAHVALEHSSPFFMEKLLDKSAVEG